MSEFLSDLMQGYGLGFFFMFTIPAFVVCGILAVEVCAATLSEFRRRRAGERETTAELASGFSVAVPDTALRASHYRPLERSLTQPFAKQVNRPLGRSARTSRLG